MTEISIRYGAGLTHEQVIQVPCSTCGASEYNDCFRKPRAGYRPDAMNVTEHAPRVRLALMNKENN